MLEPVLFAPPFREVRSKKVTVTGLIGQIPCDGIQVVISQHRERRIRFHHPPNQHDRFDLFGSKINEVADKDCLSLGMTPETVAVFVPHPRQQRDQCVCVAMNIADDVVQISHVAPKIELAFLVEILLGGSGSSKLHSVHHFPDLVESV